MFRGTAANRRFVFAADATHPHSQIDVDDQVWVYVCVWVCVGGG